MSDYNFTGSKTGTSKQRKARQYQNDYAFSTDYTPPAEDKKATVAKAVATQPAPKLKQAEPKSPLPLKGVNNPMVLSQTKSKSPPRIPKLVRDLANAATQGEQKFATGIARDLPGGTADLEATRRSSEADAASTKRAHDDYKAGKISKSRYLKLTNRSAEGANATSAELKKTTAAMPTKKQIGLGAASTAADILTAGSLPPIKSSVTAAKASRRLKAARVAEQLAANATAGGLNAAAGGGDRGTVIENAAVGAALPEVLHQGVNAVGGAVKGLRHLNPLKKPKNVAPEVTSTFKDAADRLDKSPEANAQLEELTRRKGQLKELKAQHPHQPAVDEALAGVDKKIAETAKVAEKDAQTAQKTAEAEAKVSEKKVIEVKKLDDQEELIKAKVKDTGKATEVDKVKLKQINEKKSAIKTEEPAPKAGKKPASLLDEAKKYDTPEAFIKAQKPIYHGTKATFDKFDTNLQSVKDEGGVYFTTNKGEADTMKAAGMNLHNRYLHPEAKLGEDMQFDDSWVEDKAQHGAWDGENLILKDPNKHALSEQDLRDTYAKAHDSGAVTTGDTVSFHKIKDGKQTGLEDVQYKVKGTIEMGGTKLELEAPDGKTIWTTPESVGKVSGAKTQTDIVKETVADGEKSIKQIAEETKLKEPNVRRILGVGAKDGTFERVDTGVYRLRINGEDMAYVEAGNAVDVLPRLAKEGFKSDMVFLDIPYDTPAVKGGNRGANNRYDLLSVDDFKKVVQATKTIARDQSTPIVHMYSQAKSGMTAMAKYNQVLIDEGYKPVGKGEYRKTYSNGKSVGFPTNQGYRITEPEGILVFSQSGELKKDLGNLNFRIVRPKGYHTEKPEEMLKAIIKMTTDEGDTVLDPFAGSGSTGAAALKTGRKSYNIEKSADVVDKVTKPRIEASKPKGSVKPLVKKPEAPKPPEKPIPSPKLKLPEVPTSGETKTSKLALGVEARAVKNKLSKTLGDLPQYSEANMVEQAKRATDLLAKDEKTAIDIALGRKDPPEGLLPEAVYVAVENKAVADGNVPLVGQLATSVRTSEATLMGQRIRVLAERDPEGAVSQIRNVNAARLKARSRTLKGTPEEAVKATVKEIKSTVKPTTRMDWSTFIESIKC
jgi:DNA-binding Lrp family transcriptional regulator